MKWPTLTFWDSHLFLHRRIWLRPKVTGGERQGQRHKDTERDKERQRQRDTDRDSQRDRHMKTQRELYLTLHYNLVKQQSNKSLITSLKMHLVLFCCWHFNFIFLSCTVMQIFINIIIELCSLFLINKKYPGATELHQFLKITRHSSWKPTCNSQNSHQANHNYLWLHLQEIQHSLLACLNTSTHALSTNTHTYICTHENNDKINL